MPSILNLKFKGNKSFVAFSNLNDTESLTKTWKVCTKVASFLEQGQRLENLSWRLWHLQNLMVDTDNAKSKREFKKLSKCMGDKLDKEKGRSIEELEAPDFKRNHSTDMIRQRAVEKERSREASQNAKPGTIKRMQFTFSVDQPTPAGNYPVKKPDLKPSPEFGKRPRAAQRAAQEDSDDMVVADDEANDKDPPLTVRGRKTTQQKNPNISNGNTSSASLRFPTLFSSDFGPSALLYPTPTLTTRMTYGEGHNPSAPNDGFSVMRPTIELPLDELLNNVDAADSPDSWFNSTFSQSTHTDTSATDESMHHQSLVQQVTESHFSPRLQSQDVTMSAVTGSTVSKNTAPATKRASRNHAGRRQESDEESGNESDGDNSDFDASHTHRLTINSHSLSNNHMIPPLSQAVKEVLPQTVAPSKVNTLYGTRSNTPTGRPTLTVRTHNTPATRSSGPGATATNMNSTALRQPTNGAGINGSGNSAPGGVKAECSNCGATHTPLWRRGLNDELNCNACGLYCKLHKRPRPKSMRNTHGEGRAQAAPRQETVDVMAQCYNCHTTATPLWRKDDEGKTVCNACGLYYKLHGSARPISMKSDVIRKRSRHDARRMGNGGAPDTPSASPGVSRRASPAREASPTLAPDSTTQMSYEFNEEMDYRTSQSELLGALGQDHSHNHMYQNSFHNPFPGPYHPDYLANHQNGGSTAGDALPFASSEVPELDLSMSPRTSKRRRMSTDSASEPPSSAVSYTSYNDGYSSASSATSHSQRSSMDFAFSGFHNSPFGNSGGNHGGNGNSGNGGVGGGPALRGSGNTFWHPPMMPQGDDHSPHVFHPPMLPPTEESPMDYLHPPMLPQDEESLFSAYLHPPMAIPDGSSNGSNGGSSGGSGGSGSGGSSSSGGELGGMHPPMSLYPDGFSHDSYDMGMRVY